MLLRVAWLTSKYPAWSSNENFCLPNCFQELAKRAQTILNFGMLIWPQIACWWVKAEMNIGQLKLPVDGYAHAKCQWGHGQTMHYSGSHCSLFCSQGCSPFKSNWLRPNMSWSLLLIIRLCNFQAPANDFFFPLSSNFLAWQHLEEIAKFSILIIVCGFHCLQFLAKFS